MHAVLPLLPLLPLPHIWMFPSHTNHYLISTHSTLATDLPALPISLGPISCLSVPACTRILYEVQVKSGHFTSHRVFFLSHSTTAGV